MNDILRPALHASQHPIVPVNTNQNLKEYVVVGHNCESTDPLTPSPDDPERPLPRLMPETAIGDIVANEGVGAYCSSMRTVGYNSFTTPNEVMLTTEENIKLISRSIGVDELTAGEIYG